MTEPMKLWVWSKIIHPDNLVKVDFSDIGEKTKDYYKNINVKIKHPKFVK